MKKQKYEELLKLRSNYSTDDFKTQEETKKKLTQEELDELLDEREKEIKTKDCYIRRVLYNVDISGLEIRNRDLSILELINCKLNKVLFIGCDIQDTFINGSTLEDVNFNNCCLMFSTFYETKILRTEYYNCNLIFSRFSSSELVNTRTTFCNCFHAYFTCTLLDNVSFNQSNMTKSIFDKSIIKNIGDHSTSSLALQCPEEGSFIGYKKCFGYNIYSTEGYIVKLLIPEDAKRSSATSRKCRCSKAKVLSITNLDGTDSGLESVPSGYDSKFIYKVGETVEVDDFDDNRWNECSTGIHFFITRDEAVNYY